MGKENWPHSKLILKSLFTALKEGTPLPLSCQCTGRPVYPKPHCTALRLASNSPAMTAFCLFSSWKMPNTSQPALQRLFPVYVGALSPLSALPGLVQISLSFISQFRPHSGASLNPSHT